MTPDETHRLSAARSSHTPVGVPPLLPSHTPPAPPALQLPACTRCVIDAEAARLPCPPSASAAVPSPQLHCSARRPCAVGPSARPLSHPVTKPTDPDAELPNPDSDPVRSPSAGAAAAWTAGATAAQTPGWCLADTLLTSTEATYTLARRCC